MLQSPVSPRQTISSPCIGVCALEGAGRCRGCLRTVDEITGWARMDEPQRQYLMREVLPARALAVGSLAATLPGGEWLLRALRPLAVAPSGKGWNHDDLADLLPATPPAEAAVLAGLVPRTHGVQVLLTRRTEALRNHGGQVGFPGGRIEPGDRNPVAAALRESSEEIALPDQRVQALGYLDPFVTISSFRVTPVVAVIDPDFVPVPQPEEVAEVFEVPLDFLMNPVNHRKHVWQPANDHRREWFSMPYTDPDGQERFIWGVTAGILRDLYRFLSV